MYEWVGYGSILIHHHPHQLLHSRCTSHSNHHQWSCQLHIYIHITPWSYGAKNSWPQSTFCRGPYGMGDIRRYWYMPICMFGMGYQLMVVACLEVARLQWSYFAENDRFVGTLSINHYVSLFMRMSMIDLQRCWWQCGHEHPIMKCMRFSTSDCDDQWS